jgi:hypothetical protein
MSRPVEALRKIRGLLVESGSGLVSDERIAGNSAAAGDSIGRLISGSEHPALPGDRPAGVTHPRAG